MKYRMLTVSAITTALLSSTALAEESVNDRIAKLEQEIQLLKRQLEVKQEKETTEREKSATVEMGKKGLKITSPDKKYQLGINGFVQVDDRNYFDDEANTGRNEFIARRVRPILEVKAGDASGKIMPDFAGGTTRLMDAHIDYKFSDAVKLRAGKFKPPLGLERLQSDIDMFFIERGHASNFSPDRDLGVQMYGNLFENALEYQVGIFNGNMDNSSADTDDDDRKDYEARLFATPFTKAETIAIRGLGFGIAGSYGDRDGTTGRTILSDYRTPGQQTFFRYRTGAAASDITFADGTMWRLIPQASWYWGSFGAMVEYALSSQEVTRGTSHETLHHNGWQIAASYLLTGENASYKGGVKPNEDFNLGNGIGAWELLARIGQSDMDNDTFPTFASLTQSATEATSYGAGVAWYLSENLKLAMNYDFTQFDGGATTGDRPDEHALFTRAQFRF